MSVFDQQITFLAVSDLERSSDLYGGTLGLPLVLDQGDCRIFRASSDGFIGICERPDAPDSGAVIITLVSKNVDRWHQTLVDAGVECDTPPQRNDTYNLYHAFYRDPDGHVLEIQTFLDPAWPSG